MSAKLAVVPRVQPRKLEQLRAMSLPWVDRPKLGPKPQLRWIAIEALRVNHEYQRALSDRSARLIQRMVARFDWSKVKALSVIDLGDGTFEVVDGQHTAIGALSHGGVVELPCLVSTLRTTAEAAGVFVEVNRERVALTSLQIFWAEVASGDEVACDVVAGVEQGGGRIPRVQPTQTETRFGDTLAIAQLKRLAEQAGPARIKRLVAIGVRARLRPITREYVTALSLLCWGGLAGKLDDQTIVDVIRTQSPATLGQKAHAIRDQTGKSTGAALAQAIVSCA